MTTQLKKAKYTVVGVGFNPQLAQKAFHTHVPAAVKCKQLTLQCYWASAFLYIACDNHTAHLYYLNVNFFKINIKQKKM